ncbi:MAG: hypothetical protein IJ427_10530 [Lachnospiraceae bacterium]|nr:hypothetical protein [Lachnospiraceae bacterium]MBQ8548918.1 hypothetical protein [Lachnospiraceae bacterium]
MTKNDSALMFTCSLIEYIGRRQKLSRGDVVRTLGVENITRIYKYADVLHCEPIERVADEYISMVDMKTGEFDNVKKCKYEVPDYWTIGEVYERLIEDVEEGNVVEKLMEVYTSWASDSISNYNTDFFYQPRDYIKECYIAGEVL